MSTQDIVLGLHLITLAFVGLTVLQADHLGFEWIRGRQAVLDAEEIRKFHKRTWIGLSLMIATGVILFWPMREFLLTRPQFYIKMAFVLALIINGFAIGHIQKISTQKAYGMLTKKERIPLFVSGAVSTLSWVGAAATAFFLIPD